MVSLAIWLLAAGFVLAVGLLALCLVLWVAARFFWLFFPNDPLNPWK